MIFFLTLIVKRPFHRGDFIWKGDMGVQGYFLNKQKLCMKNLTKERKQPQVAILWQSIFYNISIRYLWLRIIRRSDQGVQFMNFPSQIFFNDFNHSQRAALLKKSSLWLLPFYMFVATYCYYEKVHRTMRTAIVSYLLFLLNLQFFKVTIFIFFVTFFVVTFVRPRGFRNNSWKKNALDQFFENMNPG